MTAQSVITPTPTSGPHDLRKVPTQRKVAAGVNRRVVDRLACVVGVVLLWQLAVNIGLLSTDAVATPTAIVRELVDLATEAELWTAVGDTLRTWGIGLAISLALALPLGLLFGSSDLAYRLSRVTVDFLRTIPPVAILPLALLMYGATEKMALILIVTGSIWPVILQTMYGVHQIDPVARDVARSYRFRRRERIFDLILPSAAPFIATGIRIAATMSLLLAVGAGLLGGAPGIGASIALAQSAADMPNMYAYVVVAAFLGVLINLVLNKLEGKLLPWHPSHRPAAR